MTMETTEHKGHTARRRTLMSPPSKGSSTDHSIVLPRQRSNKPLRFQKYVPEVFWKEYWWIYGVLIICGIFATRITSHQAKHVDTDILGNNTLALLYPPGLFGGYRNQVIRLVALVDHAKKNGFSYILLPSLVWTTIMENHGKEIWVPVSHNELFDVDFWNSFQDLPKLIPYNDKVHTDWHVPSNVNKNDVYTPLAAHVIEGGFAKPIADYAKSIVSRDVVPNVRRVDLLANVSQCRFPTVYGGGKFAGRLWNSYMSMQKEPQFQQIQVNVLKALVPIEKFRNIAGNCVSRHTHHTTNYVALHARVEHEMMVHKCGRNMEKNLTKIFEMVSGMEQDVGGVFVAVSRAGMQVQDPNEKYKDFVKENLETINAATTFGLKQGSLPVFECGQAAITEFKPKDAPDYGTLLESMVNFHVATQATVFVGVRGSSYSTDIWTTRYHNGLGHSNYEYTPNGIIPMQNGGLPPLHKNC